MRRILVANRGEIAVRIIRACRDMGLESVAVYSACDRAARHVRMADHAVAIGGDPPSESYLCIDRLVDAARAAGADAVHPGYGFLSENEHFAAACLGAGLTFIGPSPDAIRLMGRKTAARRTARAAGVPVVPGTVEPFGADTGEVVIAHAADEIGYPVLVKAVAGGGGRGMRVAARAGDLADAVRAARSEAGHAFGDASVYLERHLDRSRHVEVQLLADHHGAVVPFVERECSIQRRHQKVIEESPSLAVPPTLRTELQRAAVAVVRGAGYTNAGTVEFLLDQEGRYYFLEMNTRLQVEHPVTELVTGTDLVQWQIRIARGDRLTLDPSAVGAPFGHAIECRIYAEDAEHGFLPSPGRITELRVPDGPGVRIDSAVDAGDEVPIAYDPLLAKLSVWGTSRQEALARMVRAIDEYDVRGIKTGIPFLRWLLREPMFTGGHFHTRSLDALLQHRAGGAVARLDPSLAEVAVLVAAIRVASDRPGRVSMPRTGSREAAVSLSRPSGGWRAHARREGLRS